MKNWLLKQQQRLQDCAAVLVGILMSFSFAPHDMSALAWICPAILLLLLQNCNAKRAAIRGGLFGAGFFGAGISWVYISIHAFGGTGVFMALLLTSLFVAVLSIFPALLGYLLRRFFSRHDASQFFLAFPALWVCLEWIRGRIFSGFPWLFLGYSQLDHALANYAPILSIYGVSFLTLEVAALLAWCFYKPTLKPKAMSLCGIAMIWTLGFFLSTPQWTTPSREPLDISLIQGNVSQDIKWDPSHLRKVMRLYDEMAQTQLGRDVIILPESAIPAVAQTIPNYLTHLGQMAREHGSTLVIGIPQTVANTDNFYNSIMVLGQSNGTYLKRHLVPFGEYLPLEGLLRDTINFFSIPMTSFIPGPLRQAPITVKGVNLSPFICYEIAYPHLVLNSSKNSGVLIAISDDSWFADSWAADQHLEIARMRALETGRPVLFVNNTGDSAAINPKGEITHLAPRFETFILQAELTPTKGITPILAYGTWPLLLLLTLMLLLALRLNKKKR